MERAVLDRRGFTMLELLVALGILVILTGILMPSIARLRERERRTLCSENLRKIGNALSLYAKANRDEFPRVIYDEKNMPLGYTAFTGSDAAEPFAANSGVSANDVTASLWLLIRGGYIPSDYSPASAVFVCPSTGAEADPMRDLNGNPVGARQRSNFRKASSLSYSYACPFSNAAGYGLKADFIAKDFVLLADKNPGYRPPHQDSTAAAPGDGPMEMRMANSLNHLRAGQNVLFGDIHVEFRETPYCGVGGDNIYTAQAATPIITAGTPSMQVRGVLGRNVGPAWQTDTYLVPTDDSPQLK